jgi:hypothetical protein
MLRDGLGLLCLLSGCATPVPDACPIEGPWRADLGAYEGTARVTPTGGDRVQVELIGKTTQTGAGQWIADKRRLDFDLPSGSYHCDASADCRALTCGARARPGSVGASTLQLAR